MNYRQIASEIRKDILRMHARSQSSHVGSALSCVDILVVLYFNVLKVGRKGLNDKYRDRLILSKGHAASALYASLASRHFFPKKILEGYCVDGGKLPGHVTMKCVPGVEASSGSLGHGLSIGAGMAIAARGQTHPYRVFVVLGDGECNEGSVWEAAMFAAHHRLDGLTAIIDFNGLQAFGKTGSILNLEPIVAKWESFGWAVREVDGHDCEQMAEMLNQVPFERSRPSVVIARTLKGKGVSFMEDSLVWHYKSPSKDELRISLKELDLP